MDNNNVFVMEKALMANVINTLMTLDVRGYQSMDRLVGCVTVLKNAMNNVFTPNEPETDGGEEENG